MSVDAYTAAALAAGEECRQAAHRYRDMGWSPSVCCPPNHVGVGRKHAKECSNPGKVPWHRWKELQERPLSHDEIDALYRDNPQSNVGAFTGPVSGIIRIDADGPGGEQRLQEVSSGDLPDTLEFNSGRANGGRGLLYKIPAGAILRTTCEAPKKGEELRFQAKGAQTVLPPSRHPLGSRYAWKPGHGPGEIEAALMPAWLVKSLSIKDRHTSNGTPHPENVEAAGFDTLNATSSVTSRARKYIAKMPPAISGQGGHKQTFCVACRLVLGFGLSPAAALPLLQEYNQRCDPAWTDAELEHKLTDADKQPGERGYLLNDDVHFTDVGNSKRLVREHGIDLRHCHPWTKWLCWDDARWRLDEQGAIVRKAKATVLQLYGRASEQLRELETLLEALADDNG